MFLPESLHHKLPNTLQEAKKFGKEQVSLEIESETQSELFFDFSFKKFFALPRKPVEAHEAELEALKAPEKKPLA